MNVKCIIARKTPAAKYQFITCLREGLPAQAGTVLEQHFTDAAAVEQLFSSGDIIRLGADGTVERYGACYQLEEPESPQLVDLEDVLQLAASNNSEYVYVLEQGAWSGMMIQ